LTPVRFPCLNMICYVFFSSAAIADGVPARNKLIRVPERLIKNGAVLPCSRHNGHAARNISAESLPCGFITPPLFHFILVHGTAFWGVYNHIEGGGPVFMRILIRSVRRCVRWSLCLPDSIFCLSAITFIFHIISPITCDSQNRFIFCRFCLAACHHIPLSQPSPLRL